MYLFIYTIFSLSVVLGSLSMSFGILGGVGSVLNFFIAFKSHDLS